MKNLLTCFFSLLMTAGLWGQDMVDLTFNVNTQNILVGANGIYAGGGVLGSATAYPLADPDGDGIWSTTISVANGTFGNYIFLNSPNNDADWGTKENLTGQDCADPANWNDRILPPVTEDTVINICFGECSEDGSCSESNLSLVTFSVDMNDYPAGTYSTVNLNGNFGAEWCGGCNVMTDDNGDGVFEFQVLLEADSTYEYKFTLDGWNQQEQFVDGDPCTSTIDGYVNRTLTVTSGDMVLPTPCYNSCEACSGTGPVTVEVTWQVDMSVEGANPAGVFIAGNFQGWEAGASQMTDGDGDGIYTYTQSVIGNSNLQWKFLNGPDWAFEENVPPACNTGTNRFYDVGAEDTVLDVVCFSSCASCDVVVPEYEVTFNVNMSNETVATTGVYLAGGGNFGSPGDNEMTDPDGDGTYSITLMLQEGFFSHYTFTNGACGAWSCKENLAGLECGDEDNFNDRYLPAITGPTTISTCFGECSTDGSCEPVVSTPLTLTVDVCDAMPTAVRMTGPWWGWDPNGGPVASDNGDGTWSVVLDPAPTENMEYLWVVDGVQENLIQAMVDGGTCAPVTDYANYANRLWEAGSGDASSVYNSCEACAGESTSLTLTVDVCDAMPTEVRMTGPWWGWNPTGGPVATDNGDGTWSVVLDPAPTESMEYLWVVDGVQENLIQAMVDGGTCAPITDYANYANRQWEVGSGDVSNVYNSCEACDESNPGCTDPFYAEFDLSATEDDGSCATPVVFGCIYEAADNYDATANTDDGSCEFTLNACPGDLDGDGLVATPDLLQFLSVFGTDCE